MAWVAVDKNGAESIFNNEPSREGDEWWDLFDVCSDNWSEIALPKGSIKKLIGRDLTWEDNPVELKEE